ncbi:MAG: mannitol dehydrogenase [Ruminococcaceae bacterium]|nr:mannitol dehydrogenase [Oscillospiraceae bacterium]
MKKAIMYGGGNIGRGFIGALLSQSGYEVTFIDVAEPVVKALQENHTYPVRYVSSEGHKDVWIQNVTAVNGNDTEAATDAIANCDIMATAVGARILKFIVPNIVAGLRKRWAMNKDPLNIIICENLMDANKVLEGMLKEQLTEEECAKFDETVGLVEASIGRMVPVQTEEMKDGEPLRVCVESYGFLPVDKAAFKGKVPEITNMVPYDPFDFYIKRKLYVHNMGHATCAYLGDLLGLEYIYQAIDVPEVRILVHNAMLESALALSKKYGASLYDLQLHITDLLQRFTNAALKDTCQRVGGDPARKLSPADRLIGSSLTALEMGITPAYITVGAAAGLKRYINETEGLEQNLDSARKVLSEIAQLNADDTLAQLILGYYEMLLNGCTVSDLCKKADLCKHYSLGAVI